MFSFLRRKKSTQTSKEPEKEQKNHNFIRQEALDLLQMIKDEFGLDYSKQEFVTLKKLETFAKSNEFGSYRELLDAIRYNESLKKELVNMLTVNESYFWRENAQIEAFLQLAKGYEEIEVLSAPCATGEEVYTLAMHIKYKLSRKRCKILGVDINTDALTIAKTALYSERSISKIPSDVRSRYFIKEKGFYLLDASLQECTDFKYANVFSEEFTNLGSFYFIFSRNMLIYFNDNEKKKALSQFYKLLKPGGFLFLGHADISFVPENFEVYDLSLNIYKKE